MTDTLMPAELAALPEPWNLTDTYASSVAIKALPRDDTQLATALAALEHCLTYLTESHEHFGDKEAVELPEQFYETVLFSNRKFTSQMSHFADITYINVQRWLIEDIDPLVLFGEPWNAPPPEIVGEVGRFWVGRAVGLLTIDLLRWLRKCYLERPDAPDKTRLLSMLKAAASHLTWTIGQEVVGVLWDLTEPDSYEFLRSTVDNPDTPQRTREEAARLLAYADERANRERTT